jgi:phospho-N-acetylmuramoyl-pentapeptide-transferase
MLYHLLYSFHAQFSVLNVTRYITFRTAAASLTALAIGLALGPVMIRKLRQFQIGQVIRHEGPATHRPKAGTPTMGGLLILTAALVPTLLWADLTNAFVWIAVLTTAGYGAIGFADDYLKIVRRSHHGLLPRYKMGYQILIGVVVGLVLMWLQHRGLYSTRLVFPFFKNLIPDLGWGYLWFAVFVLVAESNAVNLTDGLDGLATGLAGIAAAAFAVFAYLFGRVDVTTYLNVFYLPGAGELAVFCAALMGATIGFLWFNAHPAEVFMGDTGSLAIGGALGTVAILLKAEFLLLVIGGVFAAEAISVLLQTGTYKWFKRTRGKEYADAHRVFRMAPLHHHFEKLGWAETTVVTRFYILGLLCALVALSTLKVR